MSSSTPLLSLLDVAALDAPNDAEAELIRPFQVDDELIDLLKGEIARSYLSITYGVGDVRMEPSGWLLIAT